MYSKPKTPNEYRVEGDTAFIYLRKPNDEKIECKINASDLENVMALPCRWMLSIKRNKYYVYTLVCENGKRKCVYLHRFIANASSDFVVDHIDHDTLNNRRNNLRIATVSQNCQNRKSANCNSATGIRNIWRDPRSGKYQVRLTVNFRRIEIGVFDDIESAAKAASDARRKYYPNSADAAAAELDHVLYGGA